MTPPARFDRPARDEGVAREDSGARFERPVRLGRTAGRTRDDRFDRGDRGVAVTTATAAPGAPRASADPPTVGSLVADPSAGSAGSGYRDRQGQRAAGRP